MVQAVGRAGSIALLLSPVTIAVACRRAESIEVIALQGDAAPGTAGQTMAWFEDPAIRAATGDVVFRSGLSSGWDSDAIYEHSGGALVPIAVSGDPGPVPGSVFSGMGGASYTRLGDIVFVGDLAFKLVPDGHFIVSGGPPSLFLRMRGEPVPGRPGSTISDVYQFSMNSAGEIAFLAGVTGGIGLFTLVGDALATVVVHGDAAPAAASAASSGCRTAAPTASSR